MAEANILDKEPGILSVIGRSLKAALRLGAIGAAAGAGVAAVSAIPGLAGTEGVLNFFGNAAIGGGGWTGVLATGAAAGGVAGAALGAPLGGVAAISQMKDYYQEVAKLSQAQGMQIGAQMEHRAMAHEQESQRIREQITAQEGDFVARYRAEQAQGAQRGF